MAVQIVYKSEHKKSGGRMSWGRCEWGLGHSEQAVFVCYTPVVFSVGRWYEEMVYMKGCG
jgi:hypothetical protein